MKRFTAQIHHTADTILRMFRTREDTFHFGQKVLMSLGGVALAVLGVWNFSSIAGIVMTMVGCWLLTSLNFQAKNSADNIKKALGGQYPTNRYEFYDDHFVLLAQNQDVVGYQKLMRLVEDDGYCYLFINEQACYMLEKASLGEEREAFRAFMEKKTGMRWTKPYKLSTFNLRTIRAMMQDAREKRKK